MPPGTPEFTQGGWFVTREPHDDRAINGIGDQVQRVAGQVGNVVAARVDGAALAHAPGALAPVYGFDVSYDGTVAGRVELPIQDGVYNVAGAFVPNVDPATGAPVIDPIAQDLIATANLVAAQGSHVVEQGSRLQEDYVRDRDTRFPAIRHAMGAERAFGEYRNALTAFIVDRTLAVPGLNREEQIAVMGQAYAQAVDQLRHLQVLAAERKSGPRRGFMNALRTNRRLRIAAGLGLGVVTAFALPAIGASAAVIGGFFAARSGLAAIGGYEAGTGISDWAQSRRARRQHIGRPTTGRIEEGDAFAPAPLQGQGAAQRGIRVMGVESRPTDQNAQRLAMGRGVLNGAGAAYFTQLFDLAFPTGAGLTPADEADMIARGNELFNAEIGTPMIEVKRFQALNARRRNRAGMIGAVLFAALPGFHAITNFLHAADIIGHHGHHAANAGGKKPVSLTNPNGNNPTPGVTPAPSSNAPGTVMPGTPGSTGSSELLLNFGSHNIIIAENNASLDVSAHATKVAGHAGHAALGHHGGIHGHGTPPNISTLHYGHGDGFIAAMGHQYHLNSAQATQMYHDTYKDLVGTKGSYMINPHEAGILYQHHGTYHFTGAAQKDIQHDLNKFHHTTGHGTHNSASHHAGNKHTSTKMTDHTPVKASVTATTTANTDPTHLTVVNFGSNNVVVTGNSLSAAANLDWKEVLGGKAQHAVGNTHGGGHHAANAAHHSPKGSHAHKQYVRAEHDLDAFVKHNGHHQLGKGARANLQEVIHRTLMKPVDNEVARSGRRGLQYQMNMLHNHLDKLSISEAEGIEQSLVLAHAA